MRTPRDGIGLRLALFAVAAYAISWTLWFCAPLVGDPGAAGALDALATFGPALAAILLVPRPGPRGAPTRPGRSARIVVPLLVLGVSLLVLSARWNETRTLLAATLLAALAVLPAAIVWLSMSRDTAWRGLLGSLSVPRSPPWTYAVALAAFPALSVTGSAVISALGGDVGATPQIVREGWTSLVLVFVATLLYGGPLGEEIGWRGWVVPALQKRFSPLLTSLFVGLLWGLWHLPLHLRGVYDASMGSGLGGLALRIASSCLLAVVFTWLYNRSRGGLLVVVLLHTSVNNTSGYWLPVNIGLTVALLVMAGALVVIDRMWERPRMPRPGGTRRSSASVR
ncbi:MAG: CPBP family intramembrane glutamic endopeptidase [Microbacterium sp.]